jgi:urease accessory protein
MTFPVPVAESVAKQSFLQYEFLNVTVFVKGSTEFCPWQPLRHADTIGCLVPEFGKGPQNERLPNKLSGSGEVRMSPNWPCPEGNWSYLEVGISEGASRVFESRSVAPIRITNPRVAASSCHVLITNFGGGMVDGDNVCLEVVCREGARLNMGSVGNLQVYKSPLKGCSQTLKGLLEKDALCVVNADPVVLHSGSRFEQKQEWNVHQESSLMVAEWVVAGRLARGERFDFDEYHSDFTVLIDAHPLVVDRFEFRPDQLDYRDPALFGALACLLNIYIIGRRWTPLEERLAQGIESHRGSGPQTLASIHSVREHGYIFRALSTDRSSLAWVTDTLYEFISQKDYLGFNPAERKY